MFSFIPATHNVTVTGPSDIIESQDVTFSCQAEGGFPSTIITYQWVYDGEIVPALCGSIFSIHNTKKNESGAYVCKVQNFDDEAGWGESHVHSLDVKCRSKFSFLFLCNIYIVNYFFKCSHSAIPSL